MYGGHTIGVVVPAYNEREQITDVLASIPSLVDRVYVVDDCSTDDTYEVVQRYVESTERPTAGGPETALLDAKGSEADRGDRFVTIRHERNRGAGGAIKTGYRHALADGVDVTVTIDADGQMDPKAIPTIVDPIVEGTADYVKGNRLVRGTSPGDMPLFRWVGNWLLTGLTKVASGYWRLRDPQNGYTAISHEALDAIDVEAIYEYYGYCNDVLVKLNAAEMRVADVSMPAAYGDEESSIRYGEYIPRVSSMLLRNFLWRLRVRYLDDQIHPPAVFYLLGFATVGLAALTLISLLVSDGVGAARTAAGPILLTAIVGSGVFTAVGMATDRRENRGLEVRIP